MVVVVGLWFGHHHSWGKRLQPMKNAMNGTRNQLASLDHSCGRVEYGRGKRGFVRDVAGGEGGGGRKKFLLWEGAFFLLYNQILGSKST